MRFPRDRRITSRRLFQRVRNQGESYGGHFLVLGVLKDERLADPVKIGYITTRRLGNAVTRNRVRRRLRGVLQRTGERLKPGYCLVLVARNRAAEASSEALEKEWKWLAHRAGIFSKSEKSSSANSKPASTPPA
ncbi:MAG: ribonuclease P protein component [Verrucomicrobiae bacterium]|nr:ribonuclease P protein component [Verrucomicrobiae bacterium]